MATRTTMRRDVFQAIADPTRRSILRLLAYRALTLNAIAQNYTISRPAISKHIKILEECGLITIKQQGRERYCEAKPEKLDAVTDWVEQYKAEWNARLDSLERYLNELQSNSNITLNTEHGKENGNPEQQ